MVKIRDIEIGERPIILAPMEDVTSTPFRAMCKEFGADYMYSEFIAADGLIRNAFKSLKKLDIYDYEHPLAVQIIGNNIESMVQAAKIIDNSDADVIDINFGCPAKKVAGKGAGAGMLKDISKMVEMTKQIVNIVKKPVTVKTRLGYDHNSIKIVEIAEMLQDVGISALAIHGRTKAQMYTGFADWSEIAQVKENQRIKIPIFGNGDIKTPINAAEAFDKYGVDGILIGRATIGKPWIFKQIKYYFEHKELMPALSLDEKTKIALLHLDKSIEWKGLTRGINEMRQHLSNYFKGIPDFKHYRLKLLTTDNIDDLKKLLIAIPEIYMNISPFEEEPTIFGVKNDNF